MPYGGHAKHRMDILDPSGGWALQTTANGRWVPDQRNIEDGNDWHHLDVTLLGIDSSSVSSSFFAKMFCQHQATAAKRLG